jgi:hypothetical protein
MKKSDVVRLFRQQADPALSALGFGWRRMVDSTGGHYVREWEGGRDVLGFGLASYFPQFHLSGYATVRQDAIATLLLPHVGLVAPKYAAEFFVCHVGFATFINGLEGNRNHAWQVSTEEEVIAATREYVTLVEERVEPWLRSMRTLEGVSSLSEEWRSVCFGPRRGMVEVALAYLCSSPEDAKRTFDREWKDAELLCELERERIFSLISDLRARLALS